MVEVRLRLVVERVRKWRATGVFACTAAALALLVAFVPHRVRTPTFPYRAVNGRLSINWFYNRAYVVPLSKADAYGIATLPLQSAADRAFTISAYVRPTGARGGRACLVLVAAASRVSVAPAQTSHECLPLAAGWNQLARVTLRTDAPEFVHAQVIVSGNDGGFEARPLTVVRGLVAARQ